MTPAHRQLKNARIAAGYRSATAAALALKEANSTYCQRENGTRRLSADDLTRYLVFFGENPFAP